MKRSENMAIGTSQAPKYTEERVIFILLGLLFLKFSVLLVLIVLMFTSFNGHISELQRNVENLKKMDTTEGSCCSCPSGWKLIHSYCYYFESSAETWERSREQCATRNGVLLVMKDQYEMNALLPTIGKGRYWIGLKRNSEDTDVWLWADGTPLTFSAWNEGEPNNDLNEEHCAEILGGVQSWNDRNCAHKLGYICRGVWSC